MMKWASFSAAIRFAVVLWAGAAAAKPNTGLGIFIGPSASQFTTKSLTGTETESEYSGGSFGFDYQVGAGENFSANLFYIASYEEQKDPPTSSLFGNDYTITGFQLRGWVGGFFLGVHLSNYSRIGNRPGAGILLGGESDGGWSSLLQGGVTESANRTHQETGHFLFGFRFQP